MEEKLIKEQISVIIPVYNGEAFLAACIQSVLSQTYKNVEICIVDDGSTDATLEIIRENAKKSERIKYMHTENKGVCHARNKGIEMATGEYFTFLDADDQLCSGALQAMYDLIIKHAADISIVRSKNFSGDSSKANASETCEEKVFVWSGEEAMEKMLDDHASMHSAVSKLYKMESLGGVRFVEGRKINEDNFFVFECLTKAGRVVYQNRKEYLRFVVPGSASRSAFSDKFFDILYFAERKAEIITAEFPQFRNKLPFVEAKARRALLLNLCKTNDKKYRQSRKDCLRILRKNMHLLKPESGFDKRLYFAIRFRLFWIYQWYLHRKMAKRF